MTSRFITLTTIGFLLAAAAPMSAQSMQTGEITGVVRDKAGTPIPGATVRAKSDQTVRTVVTGPAGEFRLPLLNVGNWTLTILKAGFLDASATVRAAINETRVANFSLAPQGQAVVIVEAKGLTDPTTAQVATRASSDELIKIPMDMTSMNALDGLMSVVPGVIVSDSGVFQVTGGAANENVFVVDGNVTNQTFRNNATVTGKGPSVQPAREFIESVEVVTKAFGAEYGTFGGAVNALTKSGTNTLEGSTFYGTNFPHSAGVPFYQDKWVPASPRTPEPDKFQRYGFTVGGPIIKDKLFYFVGFQGFKDEVPPATLSANGTNWDGLKSEQTRVTGPNQWTAKINWFISPDHQLILSGTHSHYRSNSGHQWNTYGTLDQGAIRDATDQTMNLTWNWVARPDLFVVASVGTYKNPSSVSPITGTAYPVLYNDSRYFLDGPGSHGTVPANPETIPYVTGTGGIKRERSENPNTQYKVDVTWWAGINEIHAGYLRQETKYFEDQGGITMWMIQNSLMAGASADTLNAIRWDPTIMDFRGVIQSYFVKDVLELKPGLRLDLGLRADTYVYKGGRAPFEGMRLAEYDHLTKQLQPRIGLIWDVERDGRKKVFAHFGRSFVTMPMSAVSWATSSGLNFDMYFPGAWSYNTTYSNGTPINLLQSEPSFSILASGGTGKPSPHVTNLRIPRKDAITFGADWSLSKGWVLGGSWTFWQMKDILDDSYFLNADNSAAFDSVYGSKVIWNPGPGNVTFLDSDGNQHTWASNFPTPKNRYIGTTIYATHQGDHHNASVSYTWTHHYGNYAGENYANGTGDTGGSPEFDYAKAIAYGNIEADPVHMLKLNGSQQFSVASQSFTIGLTGLWQSGTALTSQMSAGGKWMANDMDFNFGGVYSDTIGVTNQRGDLGRTPSIFQLNLDLSTAIKIKNFTVRFNSAIANVFNTRARTSYYTTRYRGYDQATLMDERNFFLATSALPGRTVTAGCSINF